MMSRGTMKQTLLTACAAAALALGAGHGASAAVNTVCAEPNPAGAALSYPFQPPFCVFGGGSSLAAVVYQAQAEVHYGVTDPTFGINYSSIGSGAGQNLFLNNSSTFDTNDITPAGSTIAFGASDATLSPTQISTWATATFGQPVSGNLIQMPTFGTPIAIVFKKTTHQQEAGFQFTDDQICGIFSGKITSWQDPSLSTVPLAGSTLPTGTIHPVYRIDSSGTTFLLTQHL
jgi:phosphate transport system substrate-binding protein